VGPTGIARPGGLAGIMELLGRAERSTTGKSGREWFSGRIIARRRKSYLEGGGSLNDYQLAEWSGIR